MCIDQNGGWRRAEGRWRGAEARWGMAVGDEAGGTGGRQTTRGEGWARRGGARQGRAGQGGGCWTSCSFVCAESRALTETRRSIDIDRPCIYMAIKRCKDPPTRTAGFGCRRIRQPQGHCLCASPLRLPWVTHHHSSARMTWCDGVSRADEAGCFICRLAGRADLSAAGWVAAESPPPRRCAGATGMVPSLCLALLFHDVWVRLLALDQPPTTHSVYNSSYITTSLSTVLDTIGRIPSNCTPPPHSFSLSTPPHALGPSSTVSNTTTGLATISSASPQSSSLTLHAVSTVSHTEKEKKKKERRKERKKRKSKYLT